VRGLRWQGEPVEEWKGEGMRTIMKRIRILKLTKFLEFFTHKMVVFSCAQNDCIHTMLKLEDQLKNDDSRKAK
jgi:hypothetical protein